jgi:hypothetical protein
MKRQRNGTVAMRVAILCVVFASLAWPQDDSNSTTPTTRDSVTQVGRITRHDHDADSPRHSIIALLPDKSPARPITIEFNRSEPAFDVGVRYSFSYTPIVDDNGYVHTNNGRQVFELDENSVVREPPR